MFADIELGRRVEQSTCGLLTESAAATARRRPSADVFVRHIAGGVATYTGTGSPLNKVAGLGFDGVPEADLWSQIEQAYFDRGAAVQVEVATLGDPAVGAFLTKRGYVLTAHENVLALRCKDATALSDSANRPACGNQISVRRCADADFDRWLDIMVSGFASPDNQGVQSQESFGRDVLEHVIGDMCAAPGFARYMAFCDGEPAGGASVYIANAIAHLCGAATLPACRRRGVQSALFETRLAAAATAGCDLSVITTLPGSKSQQNAQRRGFALLYSRAILIREST